MDTRKRILLTGHNGYIGSVLGLKLVQSGYHVTGLDTGFFSECTLVRSAAGFPGMKKDLRDLIPEDLRGFDAVIHLAALSNDPIGNLNGTWTKEINFEGSVRLAELSKAAGVRRFLFSSSCIMYGMSEAAEVNEESPLDPKTEYARSKVAAERIIAQMATDRFCPTFLRNGTIYGLSPRMRFDTVLNNLVGSAACFKRIEVESDGKPWRPVVHVDDVSRAFMAVLEAPLDQVAGQAFNTGSDELNRQVIDLAEVVTNAVPGCVLNVKAERSADQRTYKASFAKFRKAFPDFEFRWPAERGVPHLLSALQRFRVNGEDFQGKRFVRLRWLNHLLQEGVLDENLKWAAVVAR